MRTGGGPGGWPLVLWFLGGVTGSGLLLSVLCSWYLRRQKRAQLQRLRASLQQRLDHELSNNGDGSLGSGSSDTHTFPSSNLDLGDRITISLVKRGSSSLASDDLVDQDRPRPLIVVLGWGGAQRNQLRHVVNWYLNEVSGAPGSGSSSPSLTPTQTQAQGVTTTPGYDVISYIPSMIGFGSRAYEVESANRFVEVLKVYLASIKRPKTGSPSSASSTSSEVPIFFHTFSNNGTRFLIRLLEHLERASGLHVKVGGFIFDSAPRLQRPISETTTTIQRWSSIPSRVWGLGRGMSRPMVAIALQKAQYEHAVLTPLFSGLFSLLTACAMLLRFDADPASDSHRRATRVFSKASSPLSIASASHLYIYSQADRLIEAEHVEAWISDLKSLRQRVEGNSSEGSDAEEGIETLLFEATAHVNHFRSKRAEYTARVLQFITKQLSFRTTDTEGELSSTTDN